ncbi:coatomer subunit delta-like [Haliotis rubra]|uniref:coatomer subunit delta-like n=1 Tax=Haliotis rubra TaxID=36100 RepID=UPI001EE538AD|nr:coatomer subunit delta-like [Haliotis rubra]
MVLLAAAVSNKAGKAIISRQFVEMTRSRIEGLLAAFPKLMNTGKQHTFVETESVRYVYQPLEKLYMLLITTKASNILEDLETLRLFAKVIPEYCRNMEESEIVDQSFSLIFAFDEIVALGYRENVNLAQIRTFTEMDSHDEKVCRDVRQTQEREARNQMRKKVKEIQQRQRDMAKSSRSGFSRSRGFGSNSYRSDTVSEPTPVEPVKSSYSQPSKPAGPSKALKLSTKKKDVDTFVGQLESEGEKVVDFNKSMSSSVAKLSTPVANQESLAKEYLIIKMTLMKNPISSIVLSQENRILIVKTTLHRGVYILCITTMVLLAAAVCNKAGKAIISRQFVEMTRSRIEGLLAAFPKLMNTGKQHTFVETESVRYVYQPLEKLYMLLITTKASNILEDLETLRLFAKVIPEYCRNMEESEIVDQSFSLIFAFDEIVALGYRENVNLAQIRTFTEMDSHEEKVFQAVRQTQEREARDQMRKKAKEIQQRQRDMAKGSRSGFSGSGGFGSNSYRSDTVFEPTPVEPVKSSYSQPSKPAGPSKALKLSTKKKDVDTFVGQLESEGEKVVDSNKSMSSTVAKMSTPVANQER